MNTFEWNIPTTVNLPPFKEYLLFEYKYEDELYYALGWFEKLDDKGFHFRADYPDNDSLGVAMQDITTVTYWAHVPKTPTKINP